VDLTTCTEDAEAGARFGAKFRGLEEKIEVEGLWQVVRVHFEAEFGWEPEEGEWFYCRSIVVG
jgi:hypothetical protein